MTDPHAVPLPPGTYELVGLPGSPYSMKMLALMRYRRIPHIFSMLLPEMSARSFAVRPLLLPILRSPNGGEAIDSTPLAIMLEESHGQGRSVLPDDPIARFLCLLIEDFADEWVTKAMFHYRWNYAEDVAYCSRWVASDIAPDGPREKQEAIAAALAERQVNRLEIVGCTGSNVGFIEASFRELLAALSDHLRSHPFLFGARPSLADFALFGQLIQLVTDPVPAAIVRQIAQDVFDWTRRTADLSGWTGARWTDEALTTSGFRRLLAMIGDIYLPYLLANEAALNRGNATFEVVHPLGTFRQSAFPYQRKCLVELRRHYRESQSELGTSTVIPEVIKQAFGN